MKDFGCDALRLGRRWWNRRSAPTDVGCCLADYVSLQAG